MFGAAVGRRHPYGWPCGPKNQSRRFDALAKARAEIALSATSTET